MRDQNIGTVLQNRMLARCCGVVGAIVAGIALGSCTGLLMENPPIEYLAVDLVQASPPVTEGSALQWTIRNCSTRRIVWVEVSFTLFRGDGVQIPEFGSNYFTTRVRRGVAPGERATFTTPLASHLESLPADAAVGLFFAREVRFSDGTRWVNFGSYHFEGDAW